MDNTQTQEFELVVTQPFGSWQKGDTITDPAQCNEILGSDNASHVVKRAKTGDGGAADATE